MSGMGVLLLAGSSRAAGGGILVSSPYGLCSSTVTWLEADYVN